MAATTATAATREPAATLAAPLDEEPDLLLEALVLEPLLDSSLDSSSVSYPPQYRWTPPPPQSLDSGGILLLLLRAISSGGILLLLLRGSVSTISLVDSSTEVVSTVMLGLSVKSNPVTPARERTGCSSKAAVSWVPPITAVAWAKIAGWAACRTGRSSLMTLTISSQWAEIWLRASALSAVTQMAVVARTAAAKANFIWNS
ncbi:hypothetical protein BX661DRAFT_177841 [Kickxella alabastrina]|uniref:uncharacterized protein n=1 Tax=Kickxella alabastrina TaxID=61397 RepID=UPI00221E5FE4|nr:uncharacterized protein BX661DRAFT_177841 [Kickxella alabastrina]KAI7833936.1 hypothetical protein BX661DRAFT_177841 [Kickxella alabastrina]